MKRVDVKLYEIADEYRDLLGRLSDPDFPADAVEDALESLTGEFSLKSCNVAAALLHMEGEAELIRRAEERMARRRKALERRAHGLRHYLRIQMEKTGIQEVRSPYFVIRVKPNPPKVIVDDEAAVPGCFKHEEVFVHIDRNAIREALQAGEVVPGTRLEQNSHVEIG